MDIERYNKDKDARQQEEDQLGYDPSLTRWLPALDQDRESKFQGSLLVKAKTLSPSDVSAPEHLIPASTDEDGEQLPDEFHISYPFGNPYSSVRSSDRYASEPKLSPRLHMNLALANNPANGRNGTNAKNAAKAPVNPDLINGALETLPSHLVLRAKTQQVPHTPDWPFVKYGTGRGGHMSLFRADLSYPTPAYRDVWADLALDKLQPRESGGVEDADPLLDAAGEGAALPSATAEIADLHPKVADFVKQLGPMGVDQFPTGLSGAVKYLMGVEEKDDMERDGEHTDEEDEDPQHEERIRAWIARKRDGPAYRPGGPAGHRFEWGKGWVEDQTAT